MTPLRRFWFYLRWDFPWWKLGVAYFVAFLGGAILWGLFGTDHSVRAFNGDDSCYVDWDGRSNPVVCD